MRDYLSPALKYVSRVISHPGTLGTFVLKRKHLSFAIAASFVVITTLGFVAVKGIMQDSTINQDAINKSTDFSSTTSLTTDNLPAPSTPIADDNQADTNDTTSSTQASDGPTVMVNNQNIPLPENGTVNKTIQSNNGTTQVNISVDSSSNSSSSSSSSTSLNVNTRTSSRSTESHSQ